MNSRFLLAPIIAAAVLGLPFAEARAEGPFDASTCDGFIGALQLDKNRAGVDLKVSTSAKRETLVFEVTRSSEGALEKTKFSLDTGTLLSAVFNSQWFGRLKLADPKLPLGTTLDQGKEPLGFTDLPYSEMKSRAAAKHGYPEIRPYLPPGIDSASIENKNRFLRMWAESTRKNYLPRFSSVQSFDEAHAFVAHFDPAHPASKGVRTPPMAYTSERSANTIGLLLTDACRVLRYRTFDPQYKNKIINPADSTIVTKPYFPPIPAKPTEPSEPDTMVVDSTRVKPGPLASPSPGPSPSPEPASADGFPTRRSGP